MMRTLMLVVGALAACASGQWHNGDPDRGHGLSAEFNTLTADSYVFEDFDHPGGTITDLVGNYLWNSNLQGYMYEIRSGVSNGFGGTLHASGDTDGAFSMVPNGDDGYGFIAYTLSADIANVYLDAGTYMVALSPIGDGTGRGFVQSTSGANAYGSPINNAHNWFHSSYFGVSYHEDYSPYDWSYAVNVPAPASVALLGLGGLVGTRRCRS